MTSLEVLALIPARGGSKGIPRKNLLPIAGKALIVHTIETALASRRITRTIVSTDDPEIADVATKAGAEVPFRRPAEHATDEATDLQVFRHALGWLAAEGYQPDLVVHLRPTQPAREAAVVDRGIDEMIKHPEADSLRSVELAEHTPYKMYCIDGGRLRPVLAVSGLPEAHNMPRQQLPPVYRGNGYVDVLRPRVLEQDSMNGALILPFVIFERVLDLDYPDQIPSLERALTNSRRPQAPVSRLRRPA
jgi:N-acylneuraminate cytidylyltransferase